jgi:RNA polymerase sigma-70 factor (ECF subfamily)
LDRQNEADLARAVIAGETNAFETFVSHFRSKIFHYSWLMCGRPEDAEEVAQETLLRVFESIDQLRDVERVRPWVFRIARNACLMQRRRSIFAPAHELSTEDLPPGTDPASAEAPPDREFLAGELRNVLDRVIAELPSPYRAVAVLRDLEELSTEETAQILMIGTDVVKTRLHRARRAMREKLDCYLHNHCLPDQPSPSPAPLTAEERERLLSVWRTAPKPIT